MSSSKNNIKNERIFNSIMAKTEKSKPICTRHGVVWGVKKH